MKPIKCHVCEPYYDCIRITYHDSIRKALKYCKEHGLSRQCIWIKDGSVEKMVFGNSICF